MSEQEILDHIAECMRSAFDVQRILLFGSRATKTNQADSDYDILVIANSEVPFTARQSMAVKALGVRSFAVDLLVFTPEEAKEAASILGSAVYWAFQEGKELYAA